MQKENTLQLLQNAKGKLLYCQIPATYKNRILRNWEHEVPVESKQLLLGNECVIDS